MFHVILFYFLFNNSCIRSFRSEFVLNDTFYTTDKFDSYQFNFFFNVYTADSANENFRSTIFKLLVLYTYVLYILYVSQLKGISCKFVAEKWSIFLVGKTNLKRCLQTLLRHC